MAPTKTSKRSALRGASPAPKRARQVHVSALALLHLKGRLPDVNTIPKPKTDPLDIFVWGSGAMCELGLVPEAKTKEVKRPRRNPLLNDGALGEGVHVVDFAAGGMHTLVLDSNNNLWSWGTNDYGVLGRDTSGAEVLKTIDGDDSDDEDASLNPKESTPGKVEGLPKGIAIVGLAATDNLSAVILDNGDVWAWGGFRNNEGVLGFLRLDKLERTPRKINELTNICQLAAGKDHLLAVDTKGVVFAWGNGQQNQLGRKVMPRHVLRTLEPQPFGLYNIKYIALGDFHCFAVDHDDHVYAWGLNQYGQCGVDVAEGGLRDGDMLPHPTLVNRLTNKGVSQIAGGEHHTIFLTELGDVYTSGRVDMKEVGIAEDKYPEYAYKDDHGRVRAIPMPTKVQVGKQTSFKCKAIGAGSHQSYAVTEDGMVYAWGFADTYALGLGNLDDDIEVPTRIHNTATKDEDIVKVDGGGQFAISGGVKLAEKAAEDRLEKYEDDDDE